MKREPNRCATSFLVTLCVWAASCSDAGKRTSTTCPSACTPLKLTTLDLLAGQPGGPGWVDGALAAAHFADPWSLARDGQGHLYVADQNMIRAIDLASGTVSTLAGGYGQVGATDGVGARASFNTPSGLAFTSGELYLTDTENHTLRKIDVQSGAVTTVAGAAGQAGAVDATGPDARFREPEGLALNGDGQFFVGDTDNDTVRVIALAGYGVTTLAGSAGTAGATDGVGAAALFSKPKALVLDGAGTLYVIDAVNQSIRKVDTTTGTVSTLKAFNALPLGIAVDGSDVLVSLSDNSVVRMAPDGTLTPLAGTSGPTGFVDGAASDARFNYPAGLLNDGAGTVYVADQGNAVIRAIALASGTVSTYAGSKSIGSADGTKTQARFSGPQGLAADGDAAYVADTGNDVIRKIALATGVVTTLAGATGQAGRVDGALLDSRFNQPQGLALDAAGKQLYIADTLNRSIRRIDLGAGIVSTVAYVPASGSTFGGFDAPSGMALDRGSLFVTDYTDDVVMAIDLQKGQISTLAGQSSAPGRADGMGTHAAFYGPIGVAADGHGNLYVADNLNETIRKIEIDTASVSTLAGEAAIPGSDDGIAGAARFHYPFGVAADAAGNLFVSDSNNNTVRHIDVSTGTVTTVIGNPAASGVRLGALPAQIKLPSAIALLPSGGLLVVSENAVLLAH